MSGSSVITDRDMRLLQAVFRAAREAAGCFGCCNDEDCSRNFREEERAVQRALDEFDLRASFRVPQA